MTPRQTEGSNASSVCSGDLLRPCTESPKEQVPPPSQTLNISLNYRLEQGGTHVMARYTKLPPTTPVSDTSLVILQQLLEGLIDRDRTAALECRALKGSTRQDRLPPCSSNSTMALEYTNAHVESA